MRRIKGCAYALALSILAVATNPVQAGFVGDTVTLNLVAHTTGAQDRIGFDDSSYTVFDPQLATLFSQSFTQIDLSSNFLWESSLDDTSIFLSVTKDSSKADPIGPLEFSVSDIDMDLSGLAVVIEGPNTLGIAPGDISIIGDSIVVSSPNLGTIQASETLAVQLRVVPEASTVAMMSIVAAGVVGYVVRRRRGQS